MDVFRKAMFAVLCFCIGRTLSLEEDSGCSTNPSDLDITIANLKSEAHFFGGNSSNLSTVDLRVTYSWEVKGSPDFDGFFYCFYRNDNASSFNTIGLVKTNTSSRTAKNGNFSLCEEYHDSKMWVTDSTGTYKSCSFPCKNELGGKLCGKRGLGCFAPLALCPAKSAKALDKNQRNVSLPLDFGQTYDFRIFVYSGAIMTSSDDGALLNEMHCGIHMLAKEGPGHRAVYEYCQTTAAAVASAPRDLTVQEIDRRFEHRTYTATLRWAPPSVGPGRPVKYLVFQNGSLREGAVFSKSGADELVDPYYNKTIVGLQYFVRYEFEVAAEYASTVGECKPNSTCRYTSEPATIILQLEDFNTKLENFSVVPHFVINSSDLSTVDLTVTYSWDVQGSEPEGFFYCFFDPDGIDKQHGTMISDVERCERFETMKTKDKFGGDYTFPCQEVDDQLNCWHVGCDCSQIKELDKDRRNVTFPIKFGRNYDFSLTPFFGSHVLLSFDAYQLDIIHLFCGATLIGRANLGPLVASEYCRENQQISNSSIAAGPPANFTSQVLHSYTDGTFDVILRWMKPYGVDQAIEHSFLKLYELQSNDGRFYAEIKPKTNEEEAIQPYYNWTFSKLKYGNPYFFSVNAYYDLPKNVACGEKTKYCQPVGSTSELVIFVRNAVNACENLTEPPFCVHNETCRFVRSKYTSTCTCPRGEMGDGVNREYKGKGCAACVGSDDCAPWAVCEVDTCQCSPGYFGNGHVSCTSVSSVAIILGSALFLALLGVLLVGFLRRRLRESKNRSMSERFSRFVSHGGSNDTSAYFSMEMFEKLLAKERTGPVFGDKWEIPRADVDIGEVIGRGNFGVVHKAQLCQNDSKTLVAVKSLSGSYDSSRRNDFLAEMALIISLGEHSNVLGVLGVCTKPPDGFDATDYWSPLIVTEYMRYGDLLHFLWESRVESNRMCDSIYDISEKSLYNIGHQVASGLHFLATAKIIHGDVAARNILVGENLQCKISDFGLANDVYRYGMIKGATERRVPFKWVSPERMMGGKVPITWRSDVWSFGILLYEMVTLGAAPYPSIPKEEVLNELTKGYRIPKPATCGDHLYQLMINCWQWEAMRRPSFAQLRDQLSIKRANVSETGRTPYTGALLPLDEAAKLQYLRELQLDANEGQGEGSWNNTFEDTQFVD